MRKVIVAVTGASGAIYARKTLQLLARIPELEEIAVIISDNGRRVMEYEGEQIESGDTRIKYYGNDDMFAPPASGSAGYDGMIIVPCSVGSAGRIASGASSGLIGRAADVMLKERRRLVLVVRETPLSTIHLRNLTALSECGAVILPASPAFYSRPGNMDALCGTVAERAVKILGMDFDHFRWGRDNNGEGQPEPGDF